MLTSILGHRNFDESSETPSLSVPSLIGSICTTMATEILTKHQNARHVLDSCCVGGTLNIPNVISFQFGDFLYSCIVDGPKTT